MHIGQFSCTVNLKFEFKFIYFFNKNFVRPKFYVAGFDVFRKKKCVENQNVMSYGT